MKNGVPFDVAFDADSAFRMAATVVFGEFEGGTFDWDRMEWEKREG